MLDEVGDRLAEYSVQGSDTSKRNQIKFDNSEKPAKLSECKNCDIVYRSLLTGST